MVVLALYALSIFLILRYTGRRLLTPARALRRAAGWMARRRLWPALIVLLVLLLLPAVSADAGIIDFVGGLISDVGEDLSDLAIDIFKPVVAAIIQAFADLICLLVETFGPLIISAFELIPESVIEAAGDVKPYLSAANHWAPIQEGGLMFAGWIVYAAFQLSIKLIIKLCVPTVG